ncbi:MAG: YqgE/AlgH family protein [Reichenbachiella sp.]
MDYFHSVQDFKPEKGDLLISEPYLPDPNFERTVVLLCAHDKNGSFGFILNKAAQVNFSEAIEEVKDFDASLYIGGPVQQDTLHFIHRNQKEVLDGQEVTVNTDWGGNYDKLIELINNEQIEIKNFKFFIGYSGWDAGQLEDEIKTKSWIVFKNTSSSLIFDTPPDELWKTLLHELGGKFEMFSKYPTDPTMN